MKKRIYVILSVLLSGLVLSLIAASCATDGTVKREIKTGENILYLNLVWHQHQPLYFRDEATGVYSRPWVRVHATKDYYDMASILEKYPDLKVTFNLTPVLLRQLDDFSSGAIDRYWELALIPAEELSGSEKQFILERFFDANHENIIKKFPRYWELLEKRNKIDTGTVEGQNSFSANDYRDLQLLFNLAWFDPDFLGQEPLASLVEKGKGFSEADKTTVFDEVQKIIDGIVPLHKRLQDKGMIEVITTPYAHPILPLLFSTSIARENDPEAELPDEFYYPLDAKAHLDKAVEVYTGKFGHAPTGLWPAEGAVAQEIVKMVSDAGFRWMATGEQVLAKSIDIGSFIRDSSDTVVEADALYRPYYVQAARGNPVAVVFRDLRISDMIGFEYSGTPGVKAAEDFISRLENIKKRLDEQALQNSEAAGPHLVSIILDGENAWENYPNDGKEFFNALYSKLSESDFIQTVSVDEYLDMFPEQRKIDDLWPGSWFSPDFATWIGEPEETKAWNYLGKTRSFLSAYDLQKRKKADPEKLAAAVEAMYFAEGSDWFWWYGQDQDSGVDEYFDEAYRSLLGSVYTILGEEVPEYLKVPIIPPRAAPPKRITLDMIDPAIDAAISPGEWDAAGYYKNSGDAQARGADILDAVYYGYNKGNMFLQIELAQPISAVFTSGILHLYLAYPGQTNQTPFINVPNESVLAGFDTAAYLEIGSSGCRLFRRGRDGEWTAEDAKIRMSSEGKHVEIAVPFAVFGNVESGDEHSISLFYIEPSGVKDQLPSGGPGKILVPDIGSGIKILEITDPLQDDHGPGTYTYPTDAVFSPGVFDIQKFTVEQEKNYLKFVFEMAGPVTNHWGSSINLSLQTFDIYIDTDPGKGSRKLLEGRNAVFPKDSGWDYAVWVEGWFQQVLVPKDPSDSASAPEELGGTDVKVRAEESPGRVTIRIPLTLFEGKDPSRFAYAAIVMSQEGYPSAGVRRIRDVQPSASQWKIGGGEKASDITRIMDMVVPAGSAKTQEEMLSAFTPATGSVDKLPLDDFAVVEFIK